jgi:hypothetical protein
MTSAASWIVRCLAVTWWAVAAGVACNSTTSGSGPENASGSGTNEAGAPSTPGNAAGSAASGAASGGQASEVAGSGGAGSVTPSGGSHTEVPSGGATGLHDCDASKLACKRAAPDCENGDVPEMEGSCYSGACVKLELCACRGPEHCPEPERYTCWSRTHCGPYVR